MRALVAFWVVIALTAVGVVMCLQVLGPVPHPAQAAASAIAGPVGPGWDGRIAPPDASLLEAGKGVPPAMLPRVAPDGRTPRLVYARPTPPKDGKPRVALVLAGFGLSEAESRAAVGLPGPVSLGRVGVRPERRATGGGGA